MHHRVVIVGGGNAGISVAARLARATKDLDIAIVEPSAKHYYQPLWTLVGGGVFPKERTEHSEASLIPSGVTWIREAAEELYPDEDALVTNSGLRIGYDFLVMAPGIQVDWHKIKGLPEALGHDGVCSNYSYQHVDKTWEFIRTFKGGNVLRGWPAPLPPGYRLRPGRRQGMPIQRDRASPTFGSLSRNGWPRQNARQPAM